MGSETAEVKLGTATASATTRHATSLKEHLKNVVRVHSSRTATSLVDLFNIGSLVVHLALLRIGKHGVRLANVLEFGLSVSSLLF